MASILEYSGYIYGQRIMAWRKLDVFNLGSVTWSLSDSGKRTYTKTASFGYRFAKAAVTFALVDFAWIFFRADSVKQALYYVKRMISFCDMWSLFDGSLYTMGLDVQEIHILMIGLTGLIVVDCLQYLKQKKIAELLLGQWCVFRWAILICLIVSCIVFGYYGQGFESANFIYLQF